MGDKSEVDLSNRVLRRDNEQAVAIINRVWGDKVAWCEERPMPRGGVMWVIVSRLVGGKLPGRSSVPRFNPGPTQGLVGARG